MVDNFYVSSGFLTVFRDSILTYIDILGSSLKVTDSVIKLKITFNPDKTFLTKVFSRVFNRALSTTRNAAASRHIRNIYRGQQSRGSIHELLAADYVESLCFLIKKAGESSINTKVSQELTQNGPISKIGLFIIQYVRNGSKSFNIPLTNYYAQFESDCSKIETTKVEYYEVFDLIRLVESLVSGDETSLISINLGHLDKTVPGFCSVFLNRNVIEESYEMKMCKSATSFDVSMAILMGMSCDQFDPSANYADCALVAVEETEFLGLWESVLMDFFFHMLKCDLTNEIKIAEKRPLMPNNQWELVGISDNDTTPNTSG